MILLISLFFVSCENISFNGSRTGNNSQFIVDFKVLNTSKTHTMNLEAGERIDVVISLESGDLKVYVYDSNNNYSYRSDKAFSTDFTLTIDHDDNYTFEIVGRNSAKGRVEFKKIDWKWFTFNLFLSYPNIFQGFLWTLLSFFLGRCY